MADIQFQCSHCGNDLTVDQEGAGLEVECPSCHSRIVIPVGLPPLLTASAKPASKSNRLFWILSFFVLSAIATGFIFAVKSHHKKNELIDSKWKSMDDLKSDAEKGDAAAQFYFGAHYQFGQGVATNLPEAVKWYQKSAEQGYASAQNYLAGCYSAGNGVPQDYAEAVKWWRKAVEQGDGPSELYLGLSYFYGNGVTKDYVEAHKWVSVALMQGYTDANMVLAKLEPLMSQEQIGIAKKAAENLFALRNTKVSAENGNPFWQCALAEDYEFGLLGVSTNIVEAVKWYHKAAEQGNAEAQFNLGVCYAKGEGVDQDSYEAVKWYRMAAEQGDKRAQLNLATMLRTGDGVPMDGKEAAKWFGKAAEQGDIQAQNMLGWMYDTGNGVPEDSVEAVKWYRKAAEQGAANAQNSLGVCYRLGKGVPKDFVQAYKWSSLASAQGDEKAKQNLLNLEQKMTSEQIAEGQRLAYSFKPNENPFASGSGFFITDDGYLISNYHVVKEAAKVRLVTSAGTVDAKVVQVDAANDLALLKADGKFSPLPIAASRSAHLGGTVATIGFPDPSLQGFSPKLAKGEIASLSGAGDDPRYFQISVPVQPGNSGGALVDERGNVIGIVSAKLDASVALAASGALPENVNYAVKSSLLLSFLESVPDVSAKLKAPNTADEKFEDVVKSAQNAAVLVLVY
jgi:TPR repeat protein/DNA-directed RNA polymerase subunit RPC12/RpoP